MYQKEHGTTQPKPVVKNVIQSPANQQRLFENQSDLVENNWDNQPSCSKTEESNYKQIKNVQHLYKLEKKELGSYIEGSKRKKKNEKKLRTQKVISLKSFVTEQPEHVHDKTLSEPSASQKLKIEKDKEEDLIHTNIRNELVNYEEMMFYQKEKNHRLQRAKEKEVLEEQNTLAETWYELIKRKKDWKEKPFDNTRVFHSQSRRKRIDSQTQYFNISFISKKFWSDEQDSDKKADFKDVKKENELSTKSMKSVEDSLVDSLENNFDKLVFVDDE